MALDNYKPRYVITQQPITHHRLLQVISLVQKHLHVLLNNVFIKDVY